MEYRTHLVCQSCIEWLRPLHAAAIRCAWQPAGQHAVPHVGRPRLRIGRHGRQRCPVTVQPRASEPRGPAQPAPSRRSRRYQQWSDSVCKWQRTYIFARYSPDHVAILYFGCVLRMRVGVLIC